MINCEHAIVQRVVLLFFFQLNLNKLYPISVIKIVYYVGNISGTKRRLCKECVGGKVNNAPGVYLLRNFAFARTPHFSPRVIA